MRRLFQNLAFDLIAVLVVGVLAVVIGWGISKHSIPMPPPLPQDRRTAQTATVTIHNNAASADKDGKVNGLRVYDPDSDNLAEYSDGSQQPLGSHVAIYVYNLASDVHLTIRHKGEIFADDDFPRLEDEKKVKFFDLILDGNLEVETKEINLKNQQGIATVHVNDSSLALVTSDGQEWSDGQDIAFGQRSVSIAAKDRDLKAQIKIGDRIAATKVILKGRTAFVDDLNIDGDIFFQLDIASDEEVKAEQEAEQEAEQKEAQARVSEEKSSSDRGTKSAGKKKGQSGGKAKSDAKKQDQLNGQTKPDTGKKDTSSDKKQDNNPEEKYATVTIEDESGSVFVGVVTDDGKESHDLNPNNMKKISSGTRLPIGTRIAIFKYYDPKYPSFKVIHNGKCIVNRENDLGGEGSYSIIELSLEGDLLVTSAPSWNGSHANEEGR